MFKKYRKKPVIIEAIQFDGENFKEIISFVGDKAHRIGCMVIIETLEGAMNATKGDYIIKGVNGEFYPCKPDVFTKTYEEVTD